jgi:hypothetical protein
MMFFALTGAKRFEEMGLDLFRNSAASVPDHDMDPIIPGGSGHEEFFGGGFFHGLNGILKQVRKSLAEIEVMPLERVELRRKGLHDFDMVFKK